MYPCPSSTNEYRQFRRLWDDSGGLTRIDNSKNNDSSCSMGKLYFRHHLGEGTTTDTTPGGTGNSTQQFVSYGVQRNDNASTKPPPPPPRYQRQHQQGGEDGAPSKSVAWEEVLRSEWSSPSDKIISAAALTASTVALSTPEPPVVQTQARVPRKSCTRAAATPEGASNEGPQTGGGSCGGGDSSCDRNYGWNRQYLVSLNPGGDLLERRCVTDDALGGEDMTVPMTISKDAWKDGLRTRGSTTDVGRAEREGMVGGIGVTEGRHVKDEGVIRWGHLDLLSVLYPAPSNNRGEWHVGDIVSVFVSSLLQSTASSFVCRFRSCRERVFGELE